MQKVDFSNIELSLYQKFVLRTLPIFKSAFFYRQSAINDLLRYGLIRRYPQTLFGNYVYKRTDEGKMYFRIKRKDFIRFWITTTISVIALFAGYDVYKIPALESLLRGIASLLERISENLGAFFEILF